MNKGLWLYEDKKKNSEEDIFRLAIEAFQKNSLGTLVETQQLGPVVKEGHVRPDRLIQLTTAQGPKLKYYL